MSLEISTESVGLIILIMAVVTLLTRWGGVFIMSFVPINDHIQRFITAMSGSVLVAILAPIAVQGDFGARCAMLSTAIAALVFKKPLLAITIGIITAAFFRQLYG
ncbi:AzlD domain-containing protein [Acinetobacter qingfengensis]|uniref:Branched-chain amino acid transporter n=1 Tax=Acinetobacter qingfengensis TaxID=1262585 RepID=A0A1E7R5J0_9GAMM|nr:AzlD domain-containing protein [Acinetobacter qingfengensis]KAA8733168.1 AzlD domain-containing protein [Acinetobacter qingfengensis]OEY94555.1 branched-chain amino acid transporter [Acinetobacter qingfengensis]